jgi:hypothetical protein
MNPSRNFWTEVKKIRGNKAGRCRIVDGCTDENIISKNFADKYQALYTSVSFDNNEMQSIYVDVNRRIIEGNMIENNYVITSQNVSHAISRLHAHKTDGSIGLSADHFLHAGIDLHMHVPLFYVYFATWLCAC